MLPIYELVLDSEYDGVNLISVVTAPAIEKDFLKFGEEVNLFEKFTKLNDEKRELFGPALLPEQLIYRNSPEIGEYLVRFSAETIKQIEERFFDQGWQNGSSLEHAIPIAATVFESFILDHGSGLCPNDFEDLPDGTWIIKMKIHNEKTWNEIKKNGYKGFSVEVLGHAKPAGDEKMSSEKAEDDKLDLEEIMKGNF